MAEFDPEILLVELRTLNDNLREFSQTSRTLQGEIKTLNERLKVMRPLTKQIFILNNILLQTSKVAGMSGVIQSLISGLGRMARRGG